MVYEPGTGTSRALSRVDSEAECGAGDFYVSGGEIVLCADMCAAVEADDAGAITVRVGCLATCGDGVMNGDEQCDDGNRTSGDGCDANCRAEIF